MSAFLKIRVRLYGLLTAAGAVVFLSTLLGFGGQFWWVLDLFSHFRVQYLISISVILSLLLIGRRFRTAAVLGLCLAGNLACVLPYYVTGRHDAPAASTVLRAISLNVNTANQNYDLVKELVRTGDPDIILLTEVDSAWVAALADVQAAYPFQEIEPRPDNFGIALYSRLPCVECKIIYLGEAGLPSVTAELVVGTRKLTVLGTHALPPINDSYSRLRNNQIEAVAVYAASIQGPKVLLGDLNTSPWSYWFRKLLKESALTDGAMGTGIRATWPTDSILLRIPIDFCLVSPEVIVKDLRIGPNVGSDHFPVIADLALVER